MAEFEEENLHLKGAGVLLELLAEEEGEGEFLELLEEIRKIIPNLISRRELPLLKTLLSTLTEVHRNAPENRKPAIERVIGEVDFAHMIDLYLSPAVSKLEKGRIEEILVSFVGVSIGDFLDRLLMETDQGNRKALLSLAFRFDADAIPAIRGKLNEPHWYFVRNLCLILGRIGDPSVVPDLVRLLDHQDLRVRKEAILALGQLRAPESIPFLGRDPLPRNAPANRQGGGAPDRRRQRHFPVRRHEGGRPPPPGYGVQPEEGPGALRGPPRHAGRE